LYCSSGGVGMSSRYVSVGVGVGVDVGIGVSMGISIGLGLSESVSEGVVYHKIGYKKRKLYPTQSVNCLDSCFL